MTLKELVKDALERRGYSGLYNNNCGCRIDDLMPCDELSEHCEPGYARKPTAEEFEYDGADFIVTAAP